MKTLLALSFALLSTEALANDRDSSRQNARDFSEEDVREINRGYYLKAGAGVTQFVGNYSGLLSGVMGLNLALGSDFVDRERSSLSWEVVFNQALHSGPSELQLPALPPEQRIQGHMHTFAGLALLNYSIYPTRRLGLGLRAGGGIMVAPVLMYTGAEHNEGYAKIVNEDWGGVPSAIHDGVLPVIAFGPTIEYYTKLSHFSVGVDIDAIYVIGLDLGIAPTGYLKYTF